MSRNRRIGAYPVIRIRPTIDGRRGYLKVRESLEEQTWSMAKAAAALFRENLRYANGEPVQVVLADTTIGGVAEAAACRISSAGRGLTYTHCDTMLVLMEPRQWTWIRKRSKRFGDLTGQSDQEQSIWQVSLQHTRRKVFQHLGSMGMKYSRPPRARFLKMSRRSFCDLGEVQ